MKANNTNNNISYRFRFQGAIEISGGQNPYRSPNGMASDSNRSLTAELRKHTHTLARNIDEQVHV